MSEPLESPGNSAGVLVWRNRVLPGSETFIRNQLEALNACSPLLAGMSRVKSPVARDDDVAMFGDTFWERTRARVAVATGLGMGRVRRFIESTGAQVVHAHFIPDAWVVSRALPNGMPLIVTVHGADATAYPALRGIRGLLARMRFRSVIRRATWIVTVSDFLASQVIALGAPAEKVRRIYIGVPAREIELAEKTYDIVFVGRFAPKKGVLDAIEAVSRLSDLTPRLAMIGDGEMLAGAKQLASELGVDVEFLGSRTPDEVANTLAASKVFIAPSKRAEDGDTEGFGMVFLEAALAGLPAVSTHSGGIPEAVLDGETGFLVPEGDVSGLSNSLRRLLEDPDLAADLGRSARLRTLRDFDIRKLSKELESLYRDAAAAAISSRGVA